MDGWYLFCCSSDELDGSNTFASASSAGNNGKDHVSVEYEAITSFMINHV